MIREEGPKLGLDDFHWLIYFDPRRGFMFL